MSAIDEPTTDAHGMLVSRTFDGTFWHLERRRPAGHVCKSCNNTGRRLVGADETMWNPCTDCAEYTTGGSGTPPWLGTEPAAPDTECSQCGHPRSKHGYMMSGGFLGCNGDQCLCKCSGFTAATSSQR